MHDEPTDLASEILLRDLPGGGGAACQRILDTLPHWFGLPESVEDYVAVSEQSPCVLASTHEEDVGIVTIVAHGHYAAKVYVMGVVPGLHRRGIGRKMLRHAESALAASGVEFLQVKTLSASKPDAGYEKTRAFYFSYGFRPLEEFPTLWGRENPALMMVKTVMPALSDGEG